VARAITPDMLEDIAARFRALGEPMRLRILEALRRGERTVGDLVEATEASQANVSKHLAVLHREGFVSRRREGLNVWYAVADPAVYALCDKVCGAIEADAAARLRTFAPRRARR